MVAGAVTVHGQALAAQLEAEHVGGADVVVGGR